MMRKYARTLALALLLLFPACSRKSESEKLVEKVKPHVDAGFKAFSEGKYQQAVEAWEEALEINPKLDYLYGNLGVCYYALGQREKALSIWMDYKEKYPKEAHIYNSIGSYYRDDGDLEKAIDYFEQAAKINPFYHLPHYNMGLAYFDEGRFAEALKAFQEAMRIAPKDIRTLVAMGRAYRAAGDTVSALDSFQKAKIFAPADLLARLELSLEYMRLGKLDQARGEVDEMKADFPNNHLAMYAEAAYLVQSGADQADVFAILEKAMQMAPQDEALFQGIEGEYLMAQGKTEQAVVKLRSVIEKLPPGFEVQKARYLFWIGRSEVESAPEDAAAHLKESVKLFPTSSYRPEIQELLTQLDAL